MNKKEITNQEYSMKISKNVRKNNPSTKKQKKIFEGNKVWIFREESKITDEEMFERWFEEFKKLKGIDDKETFRKNLAVFFKITQNEYTGYSGKTNDDNDGFWESRQDCWDCWCGFIGNRIDAWIYFSAVDNITSYS